MSAAAPDFADPPFHAPKATPIVPAGLAVGVGETVKYFARDYRNGRKEFAAIVTRVYPDDPSILDLVVVFDADDFMGQRQVPIRPGDGEIGWEPVDRGIGVTRDEFERFRDMLCTDVLGEYARPNVCLVEQLLDVRERLSKIEAYLKPLQDQVAHKPAAPKSSKRK